MTGRTTCATSLSTIYSEFAQDVLAGRSEVYGDVINKFTSDRTEESDGDIRASSRLAMFRTPGFNHDAQVLL